MRVAFLVKKNFQYGLWIKKNFHFKAIGIKLVNWFYGLTLVDFFLNAKFSLFSSKYMVSNRAIGQMSRMFTSGPENRGSISGRVIPKTQKWYSMPPCLTLSIIRYRSRVNGEMQGMEWRLLLHIGVVVIEKGAFG